MKFSGLASLLLLLAPCGGWAEMPRRGLCAHQGDGACFPGNTVPALMSAARKGAAMVEFDIRRCKTGELVLMHDRGVDRTTNGKGLVKELTFDEIRGLDAGVKRGPQFAGIKVPTFDEAIDCLPKDGIWINCHVYGVSETLEVAQKIKEKGRLHQAFISTSVERAAKLREAVPGIMTCNMSRTGTHNPKTWTDEKHHQYAQRTVDSKCEFIQLLFLCPPEDMKLMKDAGVKVSLFKCDDPDKLKPLLDAGVEFVLTDKLELMKARWQQLDEEKSATNRLHLGADDMKILTENLKQYFLDNMSPLTAIPTRVSPEGAVAGIDYHDASRGSSWTPPVHLNLMNRLAPNFPDMAGKMLDYWLNAHIDNSNWWWPQIGIPLSVCQTMILLGRPLVEGSPEWALLEKSRMGMTGQNKVWLAEIHLMKGLLSGNSQMVREARDVILAEVVVSQNEGLQDDWSYHQHGHQLQFGNYGLSWFRDMAKWMIVFRGTDYAFSQEQASLVENYYIHGLRWTLTDRIMDVNACGRQFGVIVPGGPSMEENKLGIVGQTVGTLKKAGFLQGVEGFPSGCRAYPRSGYLVSRAKDFFFSVKMSGRFLRGSETCNQENMLGLHGGDGAVYLYRYGQWNPLEVGLRDWRKIPGTTELQDDRSLVPEALSNADGACGCVAEGAYGVAAMDFKNSSMSARKAWFVLDSCIVCMGAGLVSEESSELVTSLVQTVRDAPVMLEGRALPEGETRCKGKASFAFGGMKYVLPESGDYHFLLDHRKGDWRDIHFEAPSQPIEGDMLTVWQSHGTKPADGSYVYAILPETATLPAFELIREDGVIGVKTGKVTMLAAFAQGKYGAYSWDAPTVLLDNGATVIRMALH